MKDKILKELHEMANLAERQGNLLILDVETATSPITVFTPAEARIAWGQHTLIYPIEKWRVMPWEHYLQLESDEIFGKALEFQELKNSIAKCWPKHESRVQQINLGF